MKLSIIILNYNTKNLLAQVLGSITTRVSHEVIVVDNHSADGSAEYLQSHFPEVKTLALPQNLGFSAGNNHGLKVARGEYLLLLNSDTQVAPGALDACLRYLDRHPRVGLLTPKLQLPDGSIDLSCHRGFPTPGNALAYFAKLEQLFPNFKPVSGYHQTWQDFDRVHQVDAISGAAMFIRRQLLDEIGLFDERFFMYAEDIDYCYRAKQAGWQVVYFPQATVIHHKGLSGIRSRHQPTQTSTRYHFYHTMKQYFEKHYRHKYPPLVLRGVNAAIDLVAKIRP